MLDSERTTNETDTDEAAGQETGTAPEPTALSEADAPPGPVVPAGPAVPAALFQAPQVLFQPPASDRGNAERQAGGRDSDDWAEPAPEPARPARPARRTRTARADTARADAGNDAAPALAESRGETSGSEDAPAE